MALLRAVQKEAGSNHSVAIYAGIGDLPVFSPDHEVPSPPQLVTDFASAIADADGLIIASPEYVRSIPGGLKNAIDWLVSRDELIEKPIVLAHASHRGDDMLHQLRIVLGTVSMRFNEELFLRFHLAKLSPSEIDQLLSSARHRTEIYNYLDAFAAFCVQP